METNLYEKSGWLKFKDSKTGSMSDRFVKFDGKNLIISKDDRLTNIDQQYAIKNGTVADIVPDQKNPTFTVTSDGIPAPLIFEAKQNEEMTSWINSIKANKCVSTKLKMDDFRIISVIGRGYYGKVMLVQKKDNGALFAIKSIRKSRLNDDNANSVLTEKNILMKIQHPFIVNLCFAFQTDTKVYLGLEYAPGGELFYHMDQCGTIPLDDAKLYIAEIILALSYLHSFGIIYRDLKPENVLFDEKGHIKLTDFGLSKNLSGSDSTSTFCGTCEYLAPEIVLQQPYNYKVDVWALGVLSFEMIFGQTPFGDENKVYLFDKIVAEDPVFPFLCEYKITNFILRCLTKDASKRPTFDELKEDPLFSNLDWDKVYRREYTPRFIPRIKDPLQPTNFDPEFTNEIATDSLATPGLGDIGNIPGFSFTESRLG